MLVADPGFEPPRDPLAYLFSLEQFGIKLGLDNIRLLVDALGRPDRRYRSILVAGTNGKGSVAAMVEHGLRAAGHVTGLFTSPHLVDLTERFAIDGRAIDAATLAAGAARVRDAAETLRHSGRLAHPPTFFEATTALALALFAERRVDVAVLEVGMGGRFDATNVVTPVVTAITSIDLDHQRHLGSTLAAIAFEKAGIIEPGAVVVTAETKPEALDVLRDVAATRAARLVAADREVSVTWRLHEGRTRVDTLTGAGGSYGPLTLALRGRHQIANARVAVRLLEELAGAGLPVPRAAITRALAEVRWPGRLDLLEVAPDRGVLLDAAHNVAGARALGDYVTAIAPAGLPLVFGALADKDVAGMLRALGPAVTRIVCVAPDTPRAVPAADLVERAREARPDLRVETASAPMDAVDTVWRTAPLVVAAGSIFLVGELMARLGRAPGSRSSTDAQG